MWHAFGRHFRTMLAVLKNAVLFQWISSSSHHFQREQKLICVCILLLWWPLARHIQSSVVGTKSSYRFSKNANIPSTLHEMSQASDSLEKFYNLAVTSDARQKCESASFIARRLHHHTSSASMFWAERETREMIGNGKSACDIAYNTSSARNSTCGHCINRQFVWQEPQLDMTPQFLLRHSHWYVSLKEILSGLREENVVHPSSSIELFPCLYRIWTSREILT